MVFGDRYVKLQRVGAYVNRIRECRNRVFGKDRTRTPVTVHQHSRARRERCQYGSESGGGSSGSDAWATGDSGSVLGGGLAGASAVTSGSGTWASTSDNGTSHSQQSLQRLHRVHL